MGTSGSYSGSGGGAGKSIRDAIAEYLDSQSNPGGSQGSQDPQNPEQQGADGESTLTPAAVGQIVNVFRPHFSTRGSGRGGGGGGSSSGRNSGSGGGRSGGGPRRSAAQYSGTGGRAAAAAYAYRTGDTETLERLGLNYNELRALGDDFEVLRRIVEMACGNPDSTIEQAEQGIVAADVADWILKQEDDGYLPTPEEIVRQTIASIIAETALVETGDLTNKTDNYDVAEKDIRAAAEAMSQQLTHSADGVSEDEISRAVQQGLTELMDIIEGEE